MSRRSGDEEGPPTPGTLLGRKVEEPVLGRREVDGRSAPRPVEESKERLMLVTFYFGLDRLRIEK